MNTFSSRKSMATSDRRREGEKFITPPASVIETADGYTLELEMPGVNKDGLEISVENNELSIIGRRSNPTIDGTLGPSRIPAAQLSPLV